ncbi:hypothetical protein AB0911_37385 [Streptomyces nigra]|uniref:hypothetical protein n=1 Tax=Streptomyces nigra TaxID=1827580 RepID=UPI003454E122
MKKIKVIVAGGAAVLSMAAAAIFVDFDSSGTASRATAAPKIEGKFAFGPNLGLGNRSGVAIYMNSDFTSSPKDQVLFGEVPSFIDVPHNVNDQVEIILNMYKVYDYCFYKDSNYEGKSLRVPANQSVRLDGVNAEFADQISSMRPC